MPSRFRNHQNRGRLKPYPLISLSVLFTIFVTVITSQIPHARTGLKPPIEPTSVAVEGRNERRSDEGAALDSVSAAQREEEAAD